MKVIEARERSNIEIPLNDLITSKGGLRLNSSLIEKRYIEIKQAHDRLKLQINGVVGRIPISDGLALDVQPKFPISNLNRIVYTSKCQLINPFYVDRPYQKLGTAEYLPVPLVRTFCSSLERLIENGIYRQYVGQHVIGSPKPKIDFNKSHQRFWSKNILTKAVLEQFDFTKNNAPNQLLKLAALKSLSISKNTTYLDQCVPTFAKCMRQLSHVDTMPLSVLQNGIRGYHNTIPSFRSDYKRALDLALEIVLGNDFSLNSSPDGLNLEAYIISLDSAFENYIREVISALPNKGHGKLSTVDGNHRRHHQRLFRDSKTYLIKPDFILKDRSGIRLIGDAKYKAKPKEEDRYQIITHALSCDVSRAFLVYPKPARSKICGVRRLGFAGRDERSVEIFEYFFDLNNNLEVEEAKLRASIADLIP